MADPGFPVKCPTCGSPLVYLRTDGKTHVYRCSRHRLMVLPPNGRIQPLLKRGSTGDTNARLDGIAQRARDAVLLRRLPTKVGGYLKVQLDKPTQARKALKRAKRKGK